MDRYHASKNFSIEGFAAGDKHAYSSIYRHFYQTLCFFAQQIIHDRFAAEEIVQDSFFKLWQRHSSFDRLDAIKAFLYVVTKNACLKHKKNMLHTHLNDAELQQWYEGFESEAALQMIESEVLRNIFVAVELLPEHYARVIRMSYQEGLKEREIAERLGLPVSTVSNQKARALKILREKLPDHSFVVFAALMLQHIPR